MKMAFLFNIMLVPPPKYHGTCTHFGMIWQFGFENLWLSRASSMHNNNNNNNNNSNNEYIRTQSTRNMNNVTGHEWVDTHW